MKEINQIIAAYDAAVTAGKQTALATVVLVEGSSYRRPGARMLVTEDGLLTGAISGGCLEGDALRKALLVITRKQPMLVTYDTADEDDAKFGVQLGCNGIIHILIEPVTESHNPVDMLKAAAASRQYAVIATLFSINNKRTEQPGTCLFVNEAGLVKTGLGVPALQAQLQEDAKQVLQTRTAVTRQYEGEQPFTAFIELLMPPVSLLVFGAGNDAIPLVQLADVLGWQTTVIDGRSNYATVERFPLAHRVLVAKPEAVLQQVTTDERTLAVFMTHNYNYDLAMLQLLVPLQLSYIGVLGPKKKMERMTNELTTAGVIWEQALWNNVYAPTGLDIGAETAEEIALSILAEMKSVLEKRNGVPLRSKQTTIHENR
jgi:xanthine/CO dehydrogenase XdhC/CoxF family maturation factor